MRWLKRLVFGVLAVGVLLAGLIWWDISRPLPDADFYKPVCKPDEVACAGWSEFRRVHPFPYQAIAAKPVNDKLVLVISEPGPALARSELDQLVRNSLGAAYLSAERMRWYIGTDGWVEDLVVTVDHRVPDGVDPSADTWLTDRVALLVKALHGTTFGGDIELIGGKTVANVGVPRFHVTPAELADWMKDKGMLWYGVQDVDSAGASWEDLAGGQTTGTYVSQDRHLVLLTFPTGMLAKAKQDRAAVQLLRVPFREFAVASDAVFGGLWTSGTQTAIVGRRRTTPLTAVPPLRFETFALLAAQGSDELAQSYERNAPFAGKFEDVEFAKDWAPIYLSAALVDTELGALLNITDQMLKSWSSAGDVEYVHFRYPKPATFPFGGTALPDVVRKMTGSRSVLFNWNTNGSAVVVRAPGQSVIALTEATSLPVTYGADGKPKSAGGADLLAYEKEAYDYFADTRDPNLARVVQYTAMYQLFRAIASENAPDKKAPSPQERPPQEGNAVLIEESLRLIKSIASNGKAQGENSGLLRDWFLAFRQRNPDLTDEALANLAVDRQSPATFQLFEVLKAKEQAIRSDVQAFNADVRTASAANKTPGPAEVRQIVARKAAIENRKNELDAKMTDFLEFGEKFSELAQHEDLGPIRERFLQASAREPAGTVKTPSSVLSWNKRYGFTATGGHNLRAKTLRLERSAEGRGVELVEEPDGSMVLRYEPALSGEIESHARELARAVEYGGEREVAALMKLVGQPVKQRARNEALALTSQQAPSIGSQKGFGVLGSRVYGDKKPFVDDLRQMAANNRCCVFVARDGQQTAYVTEVNLKPPPTATAYEAKDTASLLAQLKLVSRREGKDGKRAVIFLDSPDSHVEALVKTLKGDDQSLKDLMDIGEIINREPVAGQARATVFQADLSGKPSLLRSISDAAKLKGSQLLERIGLTHPPATWKTAKVEKLDGEPLDAVLKSADWQTPRDGIPRALKVTFAEGTQSPPSLAVVAGFSDKTVKQGATVMERASNGSLDKAGNQGASVAQYLMSVRNELAALPPEQLKRLVLVVDEKSAAALFTLLNHLHKTTDAG